MPKRDESDEILGINVEGKRDLSKYVDRLRDDRREYRDPRELPDVEYQDDGNDRQTIPHERNPSQRIPEKGNNLENLIGSAANQAADLLNRKKPRFSKLFIASYLDKNAIAEYAQKISPFLQTGRISPEEAHDYLASRIISGEFLTDEGREVILDKSLEEKAKKFWGWTPGARRAGKILKGEKYLDQAMEAFRDIYNLIQSDEHYSQHMPELSQAVMALYDLGFKDATLSALRKHLPEKKYMAAKLGIAEAAKQVVDYIGKIDIGIESPEVRRKQTQSYANRAFSHSVAAAILAMVGVGILFSTNSITGNVIGSSNQTNVIALISGGGALLLGLYYLIGVRKLKDLK